MAISGSAVLVGSGIVSVCSVYSRWSGWSEDCRDKSPHHVIVLEDPSSSIHRCSSDGAGHRCHSEVG